MRDTLVFEVMQTWPQWRTHWHVLHAWPPGAQALLLVFVSLCLVVAGSWQVSSVAWQTWWDRDAQMLQWTQDLEDLQRQVNQQRALKARLEAMPHPSGMTAVAWQSWPDHLALNEPQLLKDWLDWGQSHGLKVEAVQTHAEHGEGSWRGTLPQLLAAWHGLPQALPRMRVTGFDLRATNDEASASKLVLNMQWVSLKDSQPTHALALKVNTQQAKTASPSSELASQSLEPVTAKRSFLHNPFSVSSLKAGLPLQQPLVAEQSRTLLQTRPLSQMRFAGTLSAGDKRQALIAMDGLIHKVSLGDRLGQDWGEVSRIDSDHVWLREWFADVSGTWVSRDRRFPSVEKP